MDASSEMQLQATPVLPLTRATLRWAGGRLCSFYISSNGGFRVWQPPLRTAYGGDFCFCLQL